MTTDGTLVTIDGRPALRFERRFRQPAERLWRAVSSPEEMGAWFPSEVIGDRVVGRGQEPRRRQVADDAANHRGRGVRTQCGLHRGGQGGIGLVRAVLGVEAVRAVGVMLVEQVPDEHGDQVVAAPVRLPCRPAQRSRTVV